MRSSARRTRASATAISQLYSSGRRAAVSARGCAEPQLSRRADCRDPDPEPQHDRVPHDEAGLRAPDPGADPAAVGAGARVVRGAARQTEPHDLRHDLPGRYRPVHGEVRPRRARSPGRLHGRGSRRSWCATRTGTPSTDYRPAYLDQINIKIGGSAIAIGEHVLKGSGSLELDYPPRDDRQAGLPVRIRRRSPSRTDKATSTWR